MFEDDKETETQEEEVSLEDIGIDGTGDVDLELEDVGTPIDRTPVEGRKIEDEEESEDGEGDAEEQAETQRKKKGEIDSDEEDDQLSDDERKKMGKRAQRRIQTLVRKGKQKDDEIEELRQELAAARQEVQEVNSRSQSREEQMLAEHESRVVAQEEVLKTQLKSAKLDGDIDAEVEVQDKLTQVKAEKMLIQRAKEHFKAQAEAEEDSGKEIEVEASKPVRKTETVQPTEDALEWQERNPWFDPQGLQDGHVTDPSQRRLIQQAYSIHTELIEEGYVPNSEDPESIQDYYEELDERLRPAIQRTKWGKEEEQPTTPKRPSPVAGGTRTTGVSKKASTTTKLSRREIAAAERLGIKPEVYAREKAKLAKRG